MSAPSASRPSELVLDDFSDPTGASTLGTQWVGFSDRVMGGVSNADVGFDEVLGRTCIRLQGLVRLEYGGGFVQMALPFAETRGQVLDGAAYAGFAMDVCGAAPAVTDPEKSGYFLHLRTGDTRFGPSHYAAPLPVAAEWGRVQVPFSAFRRRNVRAGLDPSRLTRLGIVAAGAAFQADVAVSRLVLYSAIDA